MNPELRSVLLGFFIGISFCSLGMLVYVLMLNATIDSKIHDGIKAGLADYNFEFKTN